MLTFVLGRSSSGKTTYVRNLLAEKVNDGRKCFLIVPEQFSFESEKAVIELLGAKKADEIDIFSFTSLAKKVLDQYIPVRKPAVNDAVKAVIMSMALESVTDELEIFDGCTKNRKTVTDLLKMTDEMIQCGVSPQEMTEAAEKSGNEILKKKAKELSLASGMYETLLTDRFSDDRYMINAAAQVIAEHKLFDDADVFFDEFTGFTAQENLIVSEILRQADNVYVTQCAESLSDNSGGTGAFTYAVSNIRKLISLSSKYGVPIAEPVIMSYSGHYKSHAIEYVERGIYTAIPDVYDKETHDVAIVAARNPYEECDFVAMTAKKLVREKNLRYRDIVVVGRDDSYRKYLPFAFKKYEIPVFEDTRRSLEDELIVRYSLSALTLACEGFTTDIVLRMLKTLLFGMSEEDISLVESYVLVWQIDRKGWFNEWTGHPEGYGRETDENAEKQLKHLNFLREKIVNAVSALKENLNDGDGFSCTKAVYDFLIDTSADKNLLKIAKKLDTAMASECARSWEEFMNALSLLADTINSNSITPTRYLELFKIIISASDIGDIPTGLDEIIVGDADRIRVDNKKILFVVGANEGVFPASSEPSFVLTENERRMLKEQGLELGDNGIEKMQKERLRVYSALSIPSDMMYVCYSLGNFKGETSEPSEIVSMVKKIVPGGDKIEVSLLPPDYSVESRRSAFDSAAMHFTENSVFAASVRECAGDTEEMHDKLKSIGRLCRNNPFEFEDESKSTALFGKDMYITPSRVEKYYDCPFQYFCRYGLYTMPLKTATFDPIQNGLVVHFVLERIFAVYGSDGIIEMDGEEREKTVAAFTDDYINSRMGGKDSLTKRAEYSLMRCRKNIIEILKHLANEFRSGKFKTQDVELNIGNDGAVPSYVIDTKDGGKVYLSGIVDRVDTMDGGEKGTYLRVVDYKTGNKDFNLKDVMSGLNIQMLVYLVCLFENGSDRYGNVIPAGVLYVPAKKAANSLDRSAGEKEIEAERIKQGKMNGIVLADSDVIHGMEESGGGLIINASIDANGLISGNTFTMHQFGLLHRKIDNIASEMAESLHRGKIHASPMQTGNLGGVCALCDYKSVCCREEDGECRTAFKGDVWKTLEEAYGEEDASGEEEVFGEGETYGE